MSATGSPQLPLGLQLVDRARFETFEPGPNAEAIRAVSGSANVLLTGPSGVGKSHLLQAACRAHSAVYLSLDQLLADGPDVLQGWAHAPLIALDTLDAIAGQPAWEQAVARLLDARPGGAAGHASEASEAGAAAQRWIGALQVTPSKAGFALPDLVSRLQTAVSYTLMPLGDADRRALLERRFRHRGLVLAPEAGEYLLKHVPRDAPSLISWVDKLDWASLADQRRITLPYVRSLLRREGLARA